MMPQTVKQFSHPAAPDALSESRLSAAQFERLAEYGMVSANPNIVHGSVVFARTRVPIYNLWDYLDGGDSLEDFLDSFPTVTREQAETALSLH